MNLSPLPIQKFFDNNGKPLVGGLLFTYEAGTNNKIATYSDEAGTPNTNPVVLDYRGEANVWLDQALTYKFVLAPEGDTDPPTRPIWSVDDISAAVTYASLTADIIGQILYPRTPGEIAAGVVPLHFRYPAGIPERYGTNTNPGVTDMTAALTDCIAANTYIQFINNYGVTSITWPSGVRYAVYFNGYSLVGIASVATDCISRIKTEGSTFYGYSVNQNLNFNYTCATWWYDDASSSQFNAFFGMQHFLAVRGLVYGELPGHTSTSFAQSENSITGFRTRGVQNPFYGNHANGGLDFIAPQFTSLFEEWPNGSNPPFDAAAARSFENVAGTVVVVSGEIILAWGGTLAAEMKGTQITDVIFEISCPILITGDGVYVSGQRILNNVGNKANFIIDTGVTGSLHLSNMYFIRPPTTGSFSNQCMVDATAADPSFRTVLTNTESFEWRWNLVGVDVRLVLGGIAQYTNHRMNITAADPNIYTLNTAPMNSLLDGTAFDRLGYSVGAGSDGNWTLTNDFGGGTTLTNTTAAGPTGYLASQVTLHATGQALMGPGDPTSLATCNATMLHVRPGELYWLAAYCNISSGSAAQLQARFYDLTGAMVSDVAVANESSIGTGTWTFVEGPLAVPATAAYMNVSARGNVSDIRVTDLRVQRAS